RRDREALWRAGRHGVSAAARARFRPGAAARSDRRDPPHSVQVRGLFEGAAAAAGEAQEGGDGERIRGEPRGVTAMPLSDIRVVELGTLPAAQYCTRIFADFGAEVIKVEPPGGDPGRHGAPRVAIGAGK